jgi:hypothetical protein
MGLDDTFSDEETQADTLSIGVRALGELFKDRFQPVRGDADAAVRHREARLALLALRADGDVPPFGGESEGIRQEVATTWWIRW